MVKCNKCNKSGKQGHIFVVNDFENLEKAICINCCQPERSKREDPNICHNCFEIEKAWDEPFSGVCPKCGRGLGCGALNSMET